MLYKGTLTFQSVDKAPIKSFIVTIHIKATVLFCLFYNIQVPVLKSASL